LSYLVCRNVLMWCLLDVFCFFFQAEDGIRDSSVTGVQTCALPILRAADYVLVPDLVNKNANAGGKGLGAVGGFLGHRLGGLAGEIGRASCRERGWRSVEGE